MPSMQLDMMANTNIFFFITGYTFTFLVAFIYKVNFFNKKFFFVLLIIIGWTSSQMILHRSYFKFSPFIVLELISSFVLIKIYKNNILRRFENVTFILCCIALIGWLLNLLFHPLMKIVADNVGISANEDSSISLFFLYTVNMDSIRNCGFAWEPGRMSCMVCVGLLFYLMRSRCNFKTPKFWVMSLSVVSTLSTTGFCVYIVVLTLCYKTFHKINVVHLSILSLFVVGIMCLPFMWDKIGVVYEGATSQGITSIGNSLDWEAKNERDADRNYYVPQRFQGLMLSLVNLLNTDIIIGDGRDFTQFYINRINNWKVKTSEGILEPIVQYGVLLAFLMYYYLYRESKIISQYYNIRNKLLYFIIFLLINISYNFWETPLFMALWMSPIYPSLNYARAKATVTINHNCLLQ